MVAVFDKEVLTTPSHKIPISEVFFAIQGEGMLSGMPTVFVRTGGCDFHCGFSTISLMQQNLPDHPFVCDSLYAVDKKKYGSEWTKSSCGEVFSRITTLTMGQPILITLTGGNPALWDFSELLEMGKKHKFTFACETQGSIAQEWFKDLDYLTLSPKPPSSGQVTDWSKLKECLDAGKVKWNGKQLLENPCNAHLKIVIADKEDYDYAKAVYSQYPFLPFYLSVCSPIEGTVEEIRDAIAGRYKQIAQWISEDRWFIDVHLSFQQHAVVHGNLREI